MTDIDNWRTLKQQAVSGEFHLDPSVGEGLRAACEDYIADLEDLRRDAKNLQYLSGWGGLTSAKLLQQKFESKAVAGTASDSTDSADKRLAAHIEIAELMRDTFAAAIGKLQATDDANAGVLGAQGEQI